MPMVSKPAKLVRLLRRAFLVPVLALFAVSAWGAGLFVPLDARDGAGTSGGQRLQDAGAGNGWLVRVDQQRLFRTIHGVAARGSGRLLLNVAQGVEFEVVVERTSPTLSGYALSGRVAGVPGSAVTFAAGAEVLVGTVWTPRAVYELVPNRDGVHVFRQVDLSVRPRLAEPIRAEGGWDELGDQAAVDGAADSGPGVDVLVLWTPKALELAGGEAQMRTRIDLAVAWANDAYERSAADVRLNLVGAEEVDYVEEEVEAGGRGIASAVDLSRLKAPSDGVMDEAHERRDALGADLVSLFTGGGDASRAFEPGSFSVVSTYQDISIYRVNLAFAHELGHNMGISHDRYETSRGLLTFSHGYVNKLASEPGATGYDCLMTIMAYFDRCRDAGLPFSTPVPYFSTPDIRLSAYPELAPNAEGVPLGVPKSSDEEGADGPADAVSALDLRAPLVAGFRRGIGDDGDTADTATPVAATSTTTAYMAAVDDIDYFRVELPEAGTLRVETTGDDDLRGTLSAEDGEVIAEDDDSGDYRNFLIEVELEAGVYFVKVNTHEHSWGIDDNYVLVVSFKPASAADDHGDTAANATDAAVPSATVGELENTSDTDVFRFEVAERGVVRVGSSGETDVVGTLLSEDGSVWIADDDGGPALNFLIAAKLDPGVYFVRVQAFGGITTGAYSLDITFSPVSAEPDDHADFPVGATNIAVGASAGGELEVMLDRDHFRIDVPTGLGPGQLWVESKGDTDVKGALLRQDGERIIEESFFGHYANFVVGAQVAPGTYILRVEGESGVNTGRYDVTGRYGVDVSFVADSRVIPLFLSASHPNRWSFVRIINRDNRAGTVAIHAIDDSGERRDPVVLSLAARQAAHFNSAELENGSVTKGLSAGVGAGEGDWRLELETVLDIEALVYVRADGFLAGMNEVVTESIANDNYWPEVAPMFNFGRSQISKLRLINTGPSFSPTSIDRRDDRGARAHDSLRVWLEPGASRTLIAQEMGVGNDDLQSLNAGRWRWWRLIMQSRFPIRAMSLLESPVGQLANLTDRAHIGKNVSLPLFISASNNELQGFARIINRSSQSGSVTIQAIDDAGTRHGPVTLPLDSEGATHFDSNDLEIGNQEIGLSDGVGVGTGDWRLEFVADVNIEALAYVRTPDGFLTGMNALAPVGPDGRREVVFFNPASNDQRVSRLRLVNPADAPARITISGLDDHGAGPPEGDVTLTLPAGAATSITAQQLEAGASHFDGRFGDGRGKWRLFIEADQDIQAMSLVESPTGHLTNLSSGTAVR